MILFEEIIKANDYRAVIILNQDKDMKKERQLFIKFLI